MSLSIKYIPVFSGNIHKEVQFFMDYFNLIPAGKIKVTDDVEGILLKLDANKELYLLIMPDFMKNDKKGAADFNIIVNTNDCLKEYLLMKDSGIEFEKKPEHTPSGLAVRFNTPGGSRYMLLEERNYNELFT